MRPLILEEWPGIDPGALDSTEGDLERTVALVVDASGRTRAMSRLLLTELLVVGGGAPRTASPPRRAPIRRRNESGVAEPIESLVSSLEGHLEALAHEVKSDMAPLAAKTAREHLGLVLLLTAGIGLVVGLFLGALGYPHDEPDAEGDSDVDA